MPLLPVGSVAPDFAIQDQFGRTFRLYDALRRRNVLINFYPMDFTPICSGEVPELNKLLPRFLSEANTLPVAISSDTRFSHGAWCRELGGIQMPVLADANPHGRVSRAYGAWIGPESITDRGSVLVGRDGRVLAVWYAGKNGRRHIPDLLGTAKQKLGPGPAGQLGPGLTRDAVLYVRGSCGACRNVLNVVANLACRGVVVRDLDADPRIAVELQSMLPKGQTAEVPTLVIPDGVWRAAVGQDPIIKVLTESFCPVL